MSSILDICSVRSTHTSLTELYGDSLDLRIKFPSFRVQDDYSIIKRFLIEHFKIP